MEKIKFRAFFETEDGVNGNFFLYSPCLVNGIDFSTQRTRFEYLEQKWENCEMLEFWRNVKSFFGKVHVDLFIGLKDKNGKDIYENDIVKISLITENILPEYKGKELIWIANMQLGSDETHNIANLEPTCREVIGNVYENKKELNDYGESI